MTQKMRWLCEVGFLTKGTIELMMVWSDSFHSDMLSLLYIFSSTRWLQRSYHAANSPPKFISAVRYGGLGDLVDGRRLRWN
jgi:hypothetical protein